MRDEENLIRYWGNHMGYYLRMTECTFDEPDGGGDIGISVTFRNDGVAAPYLPVSLTAALMTKDGAVIDEQPFPADLSSVGEGEQKTFAATVRFAKDSRGVRLGIKAAAAGRPVLFGNAGLTASGYYCLSDCAQADVRVHFDGCGRGLRGLSGEHMGVNFGSELWKTVLQRDVYKVCAFRDVWFTESECRLTFPAGKTPFPYGQNTAFHYAKALPPPLRQGSVIPCRDYFKANGEVGAGLVFLNPQMRADISKMTHCNGIRARRYTLTWRRRATPADASITRMNIP